MTNKSDDREKFQVKLASILNVDVTFEKNFSDFSKGEDRVNQKQTNEVFSEKWNKYASAADQEKLYDFQRDWYLKLYGFETVLALKQFLADKQTIFDAGSGLGFKAAWLAELAPHALVVGMDYSDEASQAALNYGNVSNLFFVRGDIAETPFIDGAFDYVSCDQVIMHTEVPENTFAELARLTHHERGVFSCYFYAKKALPRELLDDYFRTKCKELTSTELWELSEQLAELGKRLSKLNVSVDSPEIPALGIKAGEIDIQRFIYWNFLKCFWNEDLGWDTSVSTNFDWYSPSNARRFSQEDVMSIVERSNMRVDFFHSEEAAHSGRFVYAK